MGGHSLDLYGWVTHSLRMIQLMKCLLGSPCLRRNDFSFTGKVCAYTVMHYRNLNIISWLLQGIKTKLTDNVGMCTSAYYDWTQNHKGNAAFRQREVENRSWVKGGMKRVWERNGTGLNNSQTLDKGVTDITRNFSMKTEYRESRTQSIFFYAHSSCCL